MTTMDWQSRLNAALSWIEEHLTEDWSWDEVAAQANCSLFHFLRMFEVVTGVTAGEYLRRRRLSEAARALAAAGATAGAALHITSPNIDSGSAIAAYAEAAPKCAQWTVVTTPMPCVFARSSAARIAWAAMTGPAGAFRARPSTGPPSPMTTRIRIV